MTTEENAPQGHVNHGLAMAFSIWAIIGISFIFFFKYRVPELASDRAGLDTLYNVIEPVGAQASA